MGDGEGGPDLRVILGPPYLLRAHTQPALSVPQLTSGHTSLFLPSFQSPCLNLLYPLDPSLLPTSASRHSAHMAPS